MMNQKRILSASMGMLLFIIMFSMASRSSVEANGPAPDFSGSSAVAYADRWATSFNSNYNRFNSDCTNFASQALHDPAGGHYPYRETGSNLWWMHWNWWGFSNTRSWSVVTDNWNFLIADNPGGWDWGYQPTNSNTNNARYGDLLFYDWDGNGTPDHIGIEAAYSGCDPHQAGYCGDLQDQHTNNHYHAIWHLAPYNDHRGTTRIRLMHIDSGN